jgi:hypothetical protein
MIPILIPLNLKDRVRLFSLEPAPDSSVPWVAGRSSVPSSNGGGLGAVAVRVLPEMVKCRKIKMKIWISRTRTMIKRAHETPKVALCLAVVFVSARDEPATYATIDGLDTGTHSLGEKIQQ